jgi:hypothetical protein
MRWQVKVWEKQRNAISVRYGPLWFSLKIGERWEKDRQQGDWAAWEVFPTTAWNDGLMVDLKNPQRSFEVIRKPKPLPSPPVRPDAAPIEWRAKGKRLPEGTMVGGIVGPLQDSPVHSDEPVEDLVLIPMGCARLRLSVFPRIADEGEQGHRWRKTMSLTHWSLVHWTFLRSLSPPMDGVGSSGNDGVGAIRICRTAAGFVVRSLLV